MPLAEGPGLGRDDPPKGAAAERRWIDAPVVPAGQLQGLRRTGAEGEQNIECLSS